MSALEMVAEALGTQTEVNKVLHARILAQDALIQDLNQLVFAHHDRLAVLEETVRGLAKR